MAFKTSLIIFNRQAQFKENKVQIIVHLKSLQRNNKKVKTVQKIPYNLKKIMIIKLTKKRRNKILIIQMEKVKIMNRN